MGITTTATTRSPRTSRMSHLLTSDGWPILVACHWGVKARRLQACQGGAESGVRYGLLGDPLSPVAISHVISRETGRSCGLHKARDYVSAR
jgi:hypothetical protein